MKILDDKLIKINWINCLSLIPIYILSLMLNVNGETKLFLALAPLIILVFSYFLEYFYFKFLKKEKSTYAILTSPAPYFNLLSFYLTSPSFNFFLYLLIITILFFLSKKIKLNQPALFKTSTAFFIEWLGNRKISFFFLGLNETYILLAFLTSILILLTNIYYKKEIPLLMLVSYFVTVYCFVLFNILESSKIIELSLNSTFIYAAIFVAPITYTSPISLKGKIFYSIALGIPSAILINLNCFLCVPYLIMLVTSIFFTRNHTVNKTRQKSANYV